MPLPNLSPAEIHYVIQQVAIYIESQRQTFKSRAVPLTPNQRTTMQPFFPASSVDSTRVIVLTGERVSNPPFYGALIGMGFKANTLPDFAEMAAITYVDTVVSHVPFTERLLFHELVHVVQYEKLGLDDFAAKYVKGFLTGGSYEAIPLEINAYQLDERFSAQPTSPFSVEAEIQKRIDSGLF